MKRWDLLIFGLLTTAIGLSAGWMAARQSGAGDDEHGHKEAAAPARVPLSGTTLVNLGVTTAKIAPGTFVRHRDVPAVIEAVPTSKSPIFAPIGGRIESILVEPGTVVAAGQPLIRFIRDPIARPLLTLTEEILKPAQESVHQTVASLRMAIEELSILSTELERVVQFTGRTSEGDLPILPKQTEIDLRYKVLRSQRSADLARLELQKHGFTDEQIAVVGKGGAIPVLGEDSWKRALQRNGLWPVRAETLLSVLPDGLHDLPWVIATVAELAASGLIDEGLISWLREGPDDCEHFLEIGALLLKGQSVADLRALHDLGALDPVVTLRAPASSEIADWDVASIDVLPGEHVETGARLVTLLNPRVVYLRAEPIGSESQDVLRVTSEGTPCSAEPLVHGSAPTLTDVTIAFVSSEGDSHGTVAFARVQNVPLEGSGALEGAIHRSWKLRPGLRYVLKVPVAQLDNVYVFPTTAVTRDGVRRVVFVEDGDSFRDVEIEVALENDQEVVVPINARSQLFPGDVVAQSGAYALLMALRGGSGAVDPHAGHQH